MGNSSMFESMAMTLEEFAEAYHSYSGKQTSSPAFQIGTIRSGFQHRIRNPHSSTFQRLFGLLFITSHHLSPQVLAGYFP